MVVQFLEDPSIHTALTGLTVYAEIGTRGIKTARNMNTHTHLRIGSDITIPV